MPNVLKDQVIFIKTNLVKHLFFLHNICKMCAQKYINININIYCKNAKYIDSDLFLFFRHTFIFLNWTPKKCKIMPFSQDQDKSLILSFLSFITIFLSLSLNFFSVKSNNSPPLRITFHLKEAETDSLWATVANATLLS